MNKKLVIGVLIAFTLGYFLAIKVMPPEIIKIDRHISERKEKCNAQGGVYSYRDATVEDMIIFDRSDVIERCIVKEHYIDLNIDNGCFDPATSSISYKC